MDNAPIANGMSGAPVFCMGTLVVIFGVVSAETAVGGTIPLLVFPEMSLPVEIGVVVVVPFRQRNIHRRDRCLVEESLGDLS